MPEYITYKFYDKRGYRLAISATQVHGGMQLKIKRCNPADNFVKKIAREELTQHPDAYETVFIPDTPVNMKTFLGWCHRYYYVLYDKAVTMHVQYLQRNGQIPSRKHVRSFRILE